MTGRGWSLVVAGLPLACLLVGCVGCFQVGWGGGFVVLCSGCEVGWLGRHMVGWLGGFMLVCGLGGLGVLLLAVGSPVLWPLVEV